MEIVLYKNLSDENRINKNLQEVKTITGKLHVNTSVINPTIWIDNDITQLHTNYCYITELERYYFIDSITLVKNNIYSLAMRCDVLTTFKDEILRSVAHITRQADYNPYYADYEIEDRNTYRKVDFDYSFPDTCNLVLITTKGVK